MSNDSREAFEAWHNTIFKASLNYVDIGNSVLYRDPFVHARWNAWQANESRHEAEREALVRKLKEMLAETNRKTMHGQGESFAIHAILALLSDSGSQG